MPESMIDTALQYHQQTSYDRYNMSGHALDWKNQPRPFKDYPGIEPVPLPEETPLPEVNLSSLFQGTRHEKDQGTMDIDRLSLMLRLTYSLTARTRYQGGDFYYRSAASAGALYPTEVYLAAEGIRGLDDGLYHFAPHRHGLNRLREGTFSGPIAERVEPRGVEGRPLAFIFSAIFFRSAWKYRGRAYRYHLMDTGHVLENLILSLRALGCPYHLSYDFDDLLMNDFLGLDASREVSLALVQAGDRISPSESGPFPVAKLPENLLAAGRVSDREIDYPVIQNIHRAGMAIRTGGDRKEETATPLARPGLNPERWIRIEDETEWPETMDYASAVLHRRSKRNYVTTPIQRQALLALLYALCDRGDQGHGRPAGVEQTLCTGFLLGEAEEMPAGFYLLDSEKRAFGCVASGLYTAQMARISLDQAWLRQAAVHFLFLADLSRLEEQWGPRGYRYAMMRAGRLGERLYVAATAMGMGCCGIGAFYDQEAVDLLGLEGKVRLLYLVAAGPVKRV